MDVRLGAGQSCLIPGGAKTFLSAMQAKALLAKVRPGDVVGKTRRKLAAELIVELNGICCYQRAP